MRILFVADVFGVPGRRAVEERLPTLREELAADFCVVNGENAADGAGITPRIADRILAAGADVITLGNHVWRRPEIGPYLAESERVIRPANVSAGSPGRGLTVAPAADGTPVAVINLLGRLFIDPAVGPFEVVDELVDEARKRAQVVVVDFHAEATSEKVALPRWLDGRVTAADGTPPHRQNNNSPRLPGGAAPSSDGRTSRPRRPGISAQA